MNLSVRGWHVTMYLSNLAVQDLEGCPKDDSDSDSDSRCSSDDGSDGGHELGLGANSINCYLAGMICKRHSVI